MKEESGEPLARPRVLLVGDASARPTGLERALTRAGFHLVEQTDQATDAGADAVLITLNDIPEGPLSDLFPATPGPDLPATPPRIVLLATTDRDAPAAALSLGASDALASPVYLPELCARLHARIRDRRECKQEDRLQSVVGAVAQPGLKAEELILVLVRRLARTFDLAHCSFVAVAPGEDCGRVVAEIESPSAEGEQLDLSRHPEIAEAVRTRSPVVKPFHQSRASETPRSLIVLPIVTGDRIAGTLLLRPRESSRRLTQRQLEFATGLARTAAGALEQAEVTGPTENEASQGTADLPDSEEALQALDRRVREEFERARRYSLSFSLILLGIDEINGIRERLGPEPADQLRREVRDVLRQQLRLPDFVMTYGSSEFAMVLPETGQIGARQSVIRVREHLAVVPTEGDPRLDRPRFSAGIVTYPHPAVSQSDELYALAEAALMRGRSQVGERIGMAL